MGQDRSRRHPEEFNRQCCLKVFERVNVLASAGSNQSLCTRRQVVRRSALKASHRPVRLMPLRQFAASFFRASSSHHATRSLDSALPSRHILSVNIGPRAVGMTTTRRGEAQCGVCGGRAARLQSPSSGLTHFRVRVVRILIAMSVPNPLSC